MPLTSAPALSSRPLVATTNSLGDSRPSEKVMTRWPLRFETERKTGPPAAAAVETRSPETATRHNKRTWLMAKTVTPVPEAGGI